MNHNLEHSIALLTHTPATLDALLRGLPDEWTLSNEGENTWNAADIVGHLIHCERADWMPRTKWILKFGESRPFEPFDRWGHLRESRGKPLPELLDEFAAMRAENLVELRAMNLSTEDLGRRGRHPALGAVTLSELLAAWTAHDLNHLHQMSRVMASQYREAAGPFQQFMGVMRCTAHGG